MMDTSNTENLLSRFREWLEETRAATDHEPSLSEPAASEAGDGEVGLYRLVEEFTALRQELKLQTKSGRGLQEQTEALLPLLRQAIEQFRSAEPRSGDAAWRAGRPLAEALADLDEALERGRSEIEKARTQLVEEPDAVLAEALDTLLARQSWLGRRLHRGYHEQVRALAAQQGAETRLPFFEALLEGYDLIRARLRRAMHAEQVERIESLGQPVDPERMVVIEVVEDAARPPGEVIEEVRRGYTWRQRVLRPAEVRAARAPLPVWVPPAAHEPEPQQARY